MTGKTWRPMLSQVSISFWFYVYRQSDIENVQGRFELSEGVHYVGVRVVETRYLATMRQWSAQFRMEHFFIDQNNLVPFDWFYAGRAGQIEVEHHLPQMTVKWDPILVDGSDSELSDQMTTTYQVIISSSQSALDSDQKCYMYSEADLITTVVDENQIVRFVNETSYTTRIIAGKEYYIGVTARIRKYSKNRVNYEPTINVMYQTTKAITPMVDMSPKSAVRMFFERVKWKFLLVIMIVVALGMTCARQKMVYDNMKWDLDHSSHNNVRDGL
eukprot:TRINITY_DN77_c0_g3_i1.p1 TRINITY_DN77_c0_g3~~TRINITY_DN77_c0_g3_i1.p1  ORF type:complete len:272 (+),score=27.39 TRINITY_DN77_c0_g3_i1:654-1469(+)